MDAQTTDFLVKVLSVLGIAILAIRDIIRTRRERAIAHDTGRLQRIKAQEEADERRDALTQGLLTQFARQADSLQGLTLEISNLVKSDLERNEIRHKADQGHDRAIVAVTESVGDLINQVGNQRKGLQIVSEQVGEFPKQMASEHGLQLSGIYGKIDTAVSQAGEMLEKKVDPVQSALDKLQASIDDIEEKVSHIPGLEQCLNDMNLALRDLDKRTTRLASERDAAMSELDIAVNENASQQQTITALRNALVVSDRDKLSKETELARLKEVLVPPSEAVPLPDRAEGVQPNVPGGVA